MKKLSPYYADSHLDGHLVSSFDYLCIKSFLLSLQNAFRIQIVRMLDITNALTICALVHLGMD